MHKVLISSFAIMFIAACNDTPPNHAFIVGGSSHGGVVTVDETSIRKTEGRVIVIERIFAPEGNPFPGGVTQHEYVLSFDCKARKYETLKEDWHFQNGNTARMGSKGLENVLPNSPVELVMKKVCS